MTLKDKVPHILALERRLALMSSVNRLDNGNETEASRIANGIYDIGEATKELVDVAEKIVNTPDGDEARDLLFEAGEILRHIQYHLRDMRFFKVFLDEIPHLQVEYLAEGSPDCPLIRIYGRDRNALMVLHDLLRRLSRREIQSASLRETDGFELIDGIEVTLFLDNTKEGIVRDHRSFEWRGSAEKWLEASELLEPLMEEGAENSFQWLEDSRRTEVAVVVSRSADGSW